MSCVPVVHGLDQLLRLLATLSTYIDLSGHCWLSTTSTTTTCPANNAEWQLKDMAPFQSILDGETLHNWRFILAANQGILPTDNDVNSINKLFIDPEVHCSIVGNRQRVMTPCMPPPTRQYVTSYKNLHSNSTLLAPADKTQQEEEHDSLLVIKDDPVTKSPDQQSGDGNDTIQILLSLPSSPSPFTPEHSPHHLAVQESPKDVSEEQVSQPLKASQIDCSQSDEYQMHSTPLRNKLFSIPAPLFTPITGEKTESCLEKSDPQPSTSKAKSQKNPLRMKLASKQMKQWTPPVANNLTSQIEGPTPRNAHGFKVSQLDLQEAKSTVTVQHICMMSLEMHMQSRGKKNPDPEVDPIQAMFVAISEDSAPSNHHLFIIVVDPKAQMRNDSSSPLSSGTPPVKGMLHHSGPPKDVQITYVSYELELISELEGLIKRWDPDILVGYEIYMASWGYLLQRASQLNIQLAPRISRIPGSKPPSFSPNDVDINLPGRIVLNLWRIMKHEVNLNIYTVENVVFHVLHQRIPRYTYQSLTTWFNHRTHLYRWRVVDYFLFRTKANLMLIDQLDIIGKTSELARVFGIEFYHVLSRGSQYRVESMMLRIAKPLNFIPVSPSVHQRAKMRAPECIPLNLEPKSRFYSHPVIVLDFQSLYPSIMIAYNYCFSTCLGRLENLTAAHEGPIEFGCTHLNVPPSLLQELEDDVTISPNGVVFVKEHIRKGIISRMVEDILNTRIMVKKSMKKCKDKALHKMLHARQLGLKLIANVTYGYTGANFSGRMPCIEVGDSIVRKARETLEKAIHLIEETPEWRAKVIYGDTDSVFVLLKGRSKEEAIRLGQHMADCVTASNPKPVKLKFEKVYLPCVLQTKKRYVGFMYETEDQKEPIFDAKGIETVRRDGCAAASKILERSIKILFTSRDVSRVKDYVLQQCHKVLEGKVNLQDFIFAKEYRGLNAYRSAACVPALEIAKSLIRKDRRAEPQSGERVPYVIVYGEPGLPLIQLVRQPWDLLADPTLRLNATYYITKQILPPLNRMFSLMGVNVFKWYSDMPKIIRYAPISHNTDTKTTISHYFNTMACLVCGNQSQENICHNCEAQPQMLTVTISNQLHHLQHIHHHLSQICHLCTGARDATLPCISLDCPILHRAHRAQQDLQKVPTLQDILCSI